jgi:hypothetical protein
MPTFDESPSSSPSSQNDLAYYKAQYEQLEADLAEFQASSRDIEAELEKDIEASERRERELQSKAEKLSYEVEEWKVSEPSIPIDIDCAKPARFGIRGAYRVQTKYKQAKAEANSAQNTLQKEITSLRDTNRTMQLRLRDIEVANDDFERQARNTTSSLEDLESKYNVAIERGVMLEEEIKVGELEREALRIESQRLRDELSDLKIEAEITQNKLRHAEEVSDRQKRKPTPLGPGSPQSPSSEHSPVTASSSPTFATPPTKSASSGASDAPTPPSPPLSETSGPKPIATPSMPKTRLSVAGSNTTPRPSHYTGRPPRHSRGPSIPISNDRSTPSIGGRKSIIGQQPAQRPGLPQSGSLYQIRGLIGKMQKLEERVQSARSKLPAPVNTPPRASPRSGSVIGPTYIPASITVRSHKKRAGGSNISGASSIKESVEPLPPPARPLSRLSYGGPPQTPTRTGTGESRPSSRTSMSSRSSLSHGGILASTSRPPSRQDVSGTRTPLGNYSANPTESRRPRSSMSNHPGHQGHSMSVSHFEKEDSNMSTPTPRRSTLNRGEIGASAIPTPGGLKKRQSGGFGMSMIPGSRRISSGPTAREEGDMAPPQRKTKLSEVGETY